MTDDPPPPREFIWATRGRDWGFRVLCRGGFERPLQIYEEVFVGSSGRPQLWRRVGDRIALRFPDPEGRTDASGRVIPHDFVLLGSLAADETFDDARDRIWRLVADEYGRIWDESDPPTSTD